MDLRIEDEEILVGVSTEEFDRRMRELISESEAGELSPVCGRIVFWRGKLPPPPNLLHERLWFLASVLAIGVFFHGLYSLGVKLFELLT